jgi:hypothetical protein
MARLHSLWKRIAASYKYRGIGFTVFWCALWALGLGQSKWFYLYRARQFDRRYGLDTAELVQTDALGIAASDAQVSLYYEPCVPETLAGILASLPIRFEDHVFVDVGSGKGIALLSASLFPFKRILGIEWSKIVADIAHENIRKFNHPRQACASIEVHNADATACELPHEPLVVFLYNPFKEPLVRRFVENLRRSLDRFPRHVLIVYYNPVCKQVFEEAGFLRKITVPGDRAPVAMYQSVAVQAAARPAGRADFAHHARPRAARACKSSWSTHPHGRAASESCECRSPLRADDGERVS